MSTRRQRPGTDEGVLILGRADLKNLITLTEVISLVRDGYVALARQEAQLFPLVRERLDGALFGLRSAYWKDRNLLGLKASGYYPANMHTGRANHQACIALFSPTTGLPRAFVDGNYITTMRTAAAGALATALLARADAHTIVVVGNGHQAEAQVRSHAYLLADRHPQFVLCAPRDDYRGTKGHLFAQKLTRYGILAEVSTSLPEALRRADIVVTATPSRDPLVRAESIAQGTHITAIGSDTPGKRELDPTLIENCQLVVDDKTQSMLFGESQGLDAAGLKMALIGDVLDGRSPGRTTGDEVTVFDSTGLGLHDVLAAEEARLEALERGVGTWISLE